MTPEQEVLEEVRAEIAKHDLLTQSKVDTYRKMFIDLVSIDSPAAGLALALVGAELAAIG